MDIKEITEFLNIELSEDSSIDDFKKKFNSKFFTKDSIPDDVHKQVVGHVNGVFENKIKKHFPELKDVGGSNVELIEKASEVYNSKLNELQEKMKEGADKNLQKAIEENNNLKSRIEEYEGRLGEVNSAFDSYKEETEQKLNNLDKSYYFKDLYSDAPFSDTTDEYWRKGFKTDFQNKYDFQKIDGEYWPTIEGKRISNPDKAGDFLDGKTLLKVELEKAGKAKVNNVQPEKRFERKIDTSENKRMGVKPAPQVKVIN